MAGPSIDAIANGVAMTGGQRYEFIAASISRKRQIRTAMDNVLIRLTNGTVTDAEARASLQSIGAVGRDDVSVTSLLSTPGGDSLTLALDAQISALDEQMVRLANQAVSLNPTKGLQDSRVYEFIPLDDQLDLWDDLGFGGLGGSGGGGGGGGWQPAPLQFQVLGNGDVLAFDPNSGSVSKAGNFPDAVQRQVEVDRNGNLVSINPFTGETKVLKEGFGFAQVDPRVQFETETAIGLANLSANLAGIEVSQRGQWVSALGQDMANRIQLGMLTYEEARTNVDTVTSALNQRRADTELALKYAVAPQFIRRDAQGNRFARLPLAEDIAAIMSDATGRTIGNNLFDVSVTDIDPNASAQDVIRAGQFNSPIPGLMQEIENTRAMVTSILNAPLADVETARAATAKIAGGL